ncbi:hypothetical protein JW906_07695 [bacterium]|nr:hypothetical protein [bacterium]
MSFRLFAAGLLVCFAVGIRAQDTQVTEVRFEQDGGKIVIRYDLSGKPGKKYTVFVELSNDEGKTFRIKPHSVLGNVGKNVLPGTGKSIVWDMQRDYPQGLEGEGFVFAVSARLQKSGKKWPYLLGLTLAGGFGYFVLRPKDDKGEMTIRLPEDI